ncbi:MAG: DUF4089 domain-containing protein [Afipia sp.]
MSSPDHLDKYIDASADILGLRIDPVWKPAVRMNMDNTLKLARLVQEFPLPDEIEPAATYEA